MDNKVLNDIKDYAVKRLKEEYRYCGVGEGEDFIMINSDDGEGCDIKINIKLTPDEL